MALPAPEPAGQQGLHHGRGDRASSNDSKRPYLREYVALGDNSTREKSFDSRYWGPSASTTS
ncbi:MAG: hypothetical protein ACLT8E_07825 [Akkermansia sp.]